VFDHPVGIDISDSSQRPMIFGYTLDGRYITVIFEEIDDDTVYPVTAFDRSHRSRGTEVVSREIRRLAEPLLPRPRAQGGGEPRQWGRLLHDAALPVAHRRRVVNAWEKISDHAGRRFSVHVDVGSKPVRPRRT
jgi:hypothetical protein